MSKKFDKNGRRDVSQEHAFLYIVLMGKTHSNSLLNTLSIIIVTRLKVIFKNILCVLHIISSKYDDEINYMFNNNNTI